MSYVSSEYAINKCALNFLRYFFMVVVRFEDLDRNWMENCRPKMSFFVILLRFESYRFYVKDNYVYKKIYLEIVKYLCKLFGEIFLCENC